MDQKQSTTMDQQSTSTSMDQQSTAASTCFLQDQEVQMENLILHNRLIHLHIPIFDLRQKNFTIPREATIK